jgi:hypothetical protein
MTDLEIIKLCYQAIGNTPDVRLSEMYNPLTNDAQAMVLVKAFELDTHRREHDWAAIGKGKDGVGHGDTLNRAICECVAKMQAAKVPT